jgi:small subunit ribosomal protein S21
LRRGDTNYEKFKNKSLTDFVIEYHFLNLQPCFRYVKQYYIIMIVIPVKEGENIDRALKKFKRKFEKTGVVKELRTRQAFTKPSVVRRREIIKAAYIQQLQDASQEN